MIFEICNNLAIQIVYYILIFNFTHILVFLIEEKNFFVYLFGLYTQLCILTLDKIIIIICISETDIVECCINKNNMQIVWGTKTVLLKYYNYILIG
jgi:hypothetical protein